MPWGVGVFILGGTYILPHPLTKVNYIRKGGSNFVCPHNGQAS
nr:MAG TPA: hypothetical protein [Caudoviricetes sp.]